MYADRSGSDKLGYRIIFGSSDIIQGEWDLKARLNNSKNSTKRP